MTQEREDVKRIAELNALFLTLDDRGQDGALTVLRALGFAQSMMCSPKQAEQPRKPPKNRDGYGQSGDATKQNAS